MAGYFTLSEVRQMVREAGGVATTFFDETADYVPALDTFGTLTTVTYPGIAVEVKGSEAEMAFEPSGMVLKQRVVLAFVPDVIDNIPPVESKVTHAGAKLTVMERWPVRPSGQAIMARVLVGR